MAGDFDLFDVGIVCRHGIYERLKPNSRLFVKCEKPYTLGSFRE
jgi:hypothetical protein